MNAIALLLLALGLYLAFKVAGLLLRLAVWLVVLGAAYWLLAPHLGLPLPG